MNLRFLLLAGLIGLALTTPANARKWTDSTGRFQMEAELVEVKDGLVQLKRPDGKVVAVPLAKLAEPADQEFVKQSQPKLANPPPQAKVDPMLAQQFVQQVFFKNIDKVREMLAAQPGFVNCEHNFQTPLIAAASAGSLELVQLLVEQGADVKLATSNGTMPLLDAAMRNDVKVVQYLIDHGADPTATAGDNYTPLHRAATKEIAELLLSLKADIAARTKLGDTPLHTAIDQGHLAVAELLIDRGADLEAVGNFNRTPLHFACKTPFGDSKAMVEMLLAKKADFRALGFIQATVVHDAAFFNKPALVELFASKGIDVNAKNQNGQTALDLAKMANNQPMIELLKKLGAKE